MNQKKQVRKAQKLARGGGDALSGHPRTAASDENGSAAHVTPTDQIAEFLKRGMAAQAAVDRILGKKP